MIMRVTWGKIRPGQWDEYERLWNEHARDTSGTPGLLARWLLRDGEQADAGYALSLWHSRRDSDAYEDERSRYPKIEACFVGQYVTTVCEVRGADLAQLMARGAP